MEFIGTQKEFRGKAGIYAIHNKVSDRYYIGSSTNVYLRRISHIAKLRNKDKNCNRHLQASWDKYGEDAFEFLVLECCESTQETLEELENKWMDVYRNDGYVLYNVRPAANVNNGIKHSEEACKKKAEITKQHWTNDEYREKVIAGIAEYWTEEQRKELAEKNRGRKLPDSAYINSAKAKALTYRIIYPNGDEEVITNLSDFCRKHKLDVSEMVKVARGKARHHKKFRCQYAN